MMSKSVAKRLSIQRDDIVQRLRKAALPDPNDEREVMCAPLLSEAVGQITALRCDYEYAASHADKGWKFLEAAVSALYRIAQIESETESMTIARDALWDLPTAGAYEGEVPGGPRDDVCASRIEKHCRK